MESYIIIASNSEIRNVINVEKSRISKPYNQTGKASIDLDVNDPDSTQIEELVNIHRHELLFTKDEIEFTIVKSSLSPGKYFDRIFRPVLEIQHILFLLPYIEDKPHITPPFDHKVYFDSINQVSFITDALLKLSRVIQFDLKNLPVYGNEIRNLIILCCTELEAQWKGILTSNSYSPNVQTYTTKDYVKLNPILKLDQYKIRFRNFPDLGVISPFDKWKPSAPTKSLEWYNSYNHIKHDREKHLPSASIENLINSIGGLVIILVAQYGYNILYEEGVKRFYIIEREPIWYDNEKYLPPSSLDNYDWEKDNCSI